MCIRDSTWRTLVLSSHTEFERTFGHQAKKKRKLYNGMLKCDLFMYCLLYTSQTYSLLFFAKSDLSCQANPNLTNGLL